MGAGELARIQREECKRTKHDSQFSKWLVLIAPSDWEDYSLRKEGAARYRVHNLPTTTGPGLYELGVAVPCNGLGRVIDKLGSDGVIAVYLGQADSVRTRLQCYGRTGAHLNNLNERGLKTEPGYFDDIFGRGLSIVYRWMPTKNKADALKTENELLKKFDYAWNKGSNGTRRHDDILQKLNKVSSSSYQFPKPVRELIYFSQKPVGIKIKASKLLPEGNKFSNYTAEEGQNLLSQVFKFSKSRPRLVLDRCGAVQESTDICGVSLGDGSVCTRLPVEGRKRCSEHRGLKINGLIPKLTAEGKSQVSNAYSKTSTSVNSECDGRDAHNFGFVPPKIPVVADKYPLSEGSNPICGVVLNDGNLCKSQPVRGNKRCDEHKGLKVDGLISKSGSRYKWHGHNMDSNFSTYDDKKYCTSVCGAHTLDGSYCKRSVKENTKCWQHSACVTSMQSRIGTDNDRRSGGTSVCGAPTRNGSYCRREVKGGGTCWQH